MTSFVYTHQQKHRIQLMMATVAIVWAAMRAPFIVMVGSSSWLLVARWSSVVGGQKRKLPFTMSSKFVDEIDTRDRESGIQTHPSTFLPRSIHL